MILIRWFLTLPVVIVTVAFCVANPQNISVTWSPVHPVADIPLYAIGLGAMALGFVWGVLLMALQAFQLRLQARRQRKQIEKLETQLAEHKETRADSNADAAREPAEQHIERLPDA